MPSRRLGAVRGPLAGVAATALTSALCLGLAPQPAHGATTSLAPAARALTGATATRPNVLYIVTDDQTVRDMSPATMPHVYRDLVAGGTRYDGSMTSYAYCCPSRASFQTGQYPQNHGTVGCEAPYGFSHFISHRRVGDTLPEWLRAAGYTTGFTGKYVNGNESARAAIPRGWSEWHAFGKGVYNYRSQQEVIARDGVRQGVRTHRTYTSTTTGDLTSGMISRLSRRGAPWFVEAAFVAPHAGSDGHEKDNPRRLDDPGVEKRFRNSFHGRRMTLTPAYDEADVSDKNTWIRNLPRISPRLRAQQQEAWEQRQEALRSVDAQVGRLVQQLRATGQLARTVVVFTSDNGYDLGDHRHPQGKMMPYESTTDVPLVVRGPGFPAGAVRHQPVQTIDVSATIADLAHARTPASVDGISFLPSATDSAWRASRVLLLRQYQNLVYRGARTQRYTYVETQDRYRTVELYDHAVDPFETRSVAKDLLYAPVVEELHARTAELAACRGATCDLDSTADSLVTVARARAGWHA